MNWCYVKETWEGFELNQIIMSLRALEQFLMVGKTLFKSYERWALGIGQPEVVTVTKIGGHLPEVLMVGQLSSELALLIKYE